MKILFSFIDPVNDFHKENPLRVLSHGIHSEFYQNQIKDYDQHILLSEGLQNKPDPENEENLILWKQFRALRDYLEMEIEDNNLTHTLRYAHLNNENQTTLLDEIVSLINDIQREFPDTILEAFITPGTDLSKSTWYSVKSKIPIDLFDIPYIHERNDSAIQKSRTYKARALDSHSEKEDDHKLNLFTNNEGMKRVYERAKKIASEHDKIGIVIIGETGTGKEEIAKHIYRHSLRKLKKGEYCAVNCAGFTDELLRSELFGHEKGAFTDAIYTKQGFFQKANNGMLFLDEIGDITPFMQSALLRVLQSGEIQKVGGTDTEHVNVQIIYATNANLLEKVKAKEFREDLYHRMFGVAIETIPLRAFSREERIEIFEHFLIEESKKIISYKDGDRDRERKYLAEDALETLLLYSFPGNFRELHGLIEGLYVTVEGRHIARDDLPARINHDDIVDHLNVDYAIIDKVLEVYELADGNKTLAAKLLKMSTNTLNKYLNLNKKDEK